MCGGVELITVAPRWGVYLINCIFSVGKFGHVKILGEVGDVFTLDPWIV